MYCINSGQVYPKARPRALLVRGLCALVVLQAAACSSTGPIAPPRSGLEAITLSDSVRPQDDFYRYVNDHWLSTTEIPADKTRYGGFDVVYDRTELRLKGLVEAAAEQPEAGSASLARVGALYASFMNTAERERRGLTPLTELLGQLAVLPDHEAVAAAFGRLQHLGVSVPLAFFVEAAADDPTRYLPYFWQSGLGLPDRSYYLDEGEKYQANRVAYVEHIERMLVLAGFAAPAEAAQTIFDLELRLAQRHWTRVQNRDRERIYRNQVTFAELDSQGFWQAVLGGGGFGDVPLGVLAQDDYFAALPAFVADVSVPHWRLYLQYHTLAAYAPYLSEAFVAENFSFYRQTLRGQSEQRPTWKRGISLVNALIGEDLGALYVAEYFPESAKASISELVENLRGAFAESITSLAWMGDATKRQALDKLAAFESKLGYPDDFRDYGIELAAEDLVGNVLLAREAEGRFEIDKLTKPVDRSEWGMSPQTVNAYYRPTFNQIVFPAAILQPPFFDPDIDAALNYGAIGAVIGHEFSHGFDDQGRKFDGRGRLRDWWTAGDAQAYVARADRLVAQYDDYTPLPDTPINGRLTLGENIGDLAGLTMAYRAYRRSLGDQDPPVIDGLTGDQRFFAGWAIVWRTLWRDAALRERLVTDSHSPGEYRVIGVMKNMDAFHEAWNTQPGDGMYLAPERRVRIW
ncbi:MAG: M13 family metallopeptidase [Pseudomonadota bacterium]